MTTPNAATLSDEAMLAIRRECRAMNNAENNDLIRAGYAAGAASVRAVPVAWQLLNSRGQPKDWIRLNPPIDDTEQWRPLYALSAAPQPADGEQPAHGDDLVRRFACFTMEDGVYEHPQGEHVAYTDYAKAAAAIVALRERIKGLERKRDAFYMDYRMQADIDTKTAHHRAEHAYERAERAEAEVARLMQERGEREVTRRSVRYIAMVDRLAKAEADLAACREVLRELVACDDLYRLTVGPDKTEWDRRETAAWQAARQLLAEGKA